MTPGPATVPLPVANASPGAARLRLPPRTVFIEPAVEFVSAYAKQLGMACAELELLGASMRSALSTVLAASGGGTAFDEAVSVAVSESAGRLTVEILNRGLPLTGGLEAASGEKGPEVAIENFGRKGQRLTLRFALGPAGSRALAPEPATAPAVTGPVERVDFRPLASGEEPELSRLFYRVYGYDYINEYVYYPDTLAGMIREGKLISIVAALPGGRLAGHVGLVRWNEEPPVYEAALGLVDPEVKSSGLFGRTFDRAMQAAAETKMQYCFFDFVTNHDYSQKLIARYGTRDLALLAGCQGKSTQARLERIGIGKDPEGMDRYSILLSILPQAKKPFGSRVALAPYVGESLGFLLEPLGLSWSPTPRFDQLPPEGRHGVQYQPGQQAALFELPQPGRRALAEVLAEWRRLLETGYQYAAVDFPLDAPGVAQLSDALAEAGFFMAGFVPWRYSGRLGFRYQAVAPTRVAFDQISVHTPAARRLLGAVRRDYERNSRR